MPKAEKPNAKKEPVHDSPEPLELSEDKLESVAGGQTNCIPVDPVTSDVLPMPQFPTIKELL